MSSDTCWTLPDDVGHNPTGAAVGLGAAAVGGATVAGRAVADVGVDAGRGALDVMSKVG